MMRPDLDGLLVKSEEALFLIFEGQRHLIADDDVRTAIFTDPRPIMTSIEEVDEGNPLQKGTSLIRDDNEGPIYLLSISNGVALRRLIKNYESFQEYGFAMDKVVHLPAAVIHLIPEGAALTGAMTRVGRW